MVAVHVVPWFTNHDAHVGYYKYNDTPHLHFLSLDQML